MTMPDERYRAVKKLKDAAMLIFERGDKRPSLSDLRYAIRAALKHYPNDSDMETIAECKTCSKIFEKDE